jgi:hypothetical protein
MICRWLLARLEVDIRALVRDEVDFCLIDIGLDEQVIKELVDQRIAESLNDLADVLQHHRG